MNANKKKGLLLLTSLGTAIIAVGAITLSTAFNNTFIGYADETISSSIVFSRAKGSFYNISGDGKTASVSGSTLGGYNFYLVSHNDNSITSTNYVASVRSYGDYTSSKFIEFTTDKEGTTPAYFQSITGIKITTTGSYVQMSVYYSEDGINYSSNKYYSFSIEDGTKPEKYTFANPVHYLKIITSSFVKNISSVELFYTCSLSK